MSMLDSYGNSLNCLDNRWLCLGCGKECMHFLDVRVSPSIHLGQVALQVPSTGGHGESLL